VAHFSCRRPQVVAGDNLGALTGQLGCRESAKGVDAGHPLADFCPIQRSGKGSELLGAEAKGLCLEDLRRCG
jgi:hypothetical protein